MKASTFSKLMSVIMVLALLLTVFVGCNVGGVGTAEDGKDGLTPYIKDGYWWIGENNTFVQAQGANGEAGSDGAQGEKGEQGDKGEQGSQGEQGLQGVGISSAYINSENHLILVLTDGTEIDAGEVSGGSNNNQNGGSNNQNGGSNTTTYTVTFNLNGDTVNTPPQPQTVVSGGCASAPNYSMREGYTLTGWYRDAACTQLFNFATPITGNITLYAGWRANNSGGDYSASSQRKQEELDNIRQLNSGNLPEIILSGSSYTPAFILGTFSSTTVTDFDSAVSSLNDVQNIMGITNASQEYTNAGVTTVLDNTTQYRMQQTHNGYPVYGQQLIVTTNQNGTVTSLSGDHVTINSDFNSSVNVSRDDAAAIVANNGFGEVSDSDGTLSVYTMDGHNEMAYIFDDGAYTVVVSANDGLILKSFNNIMVALPSDEGNTEHTLGRQESNDTDTFNTVWFDFIDDGMTDTFYFYDSVRNIVYHDVSMQQFTNILEYYNLNPMLDDDNIWTSDADDKAVDLYKNLAATYDFYLNTLGLVSYNGNGGQILAYVNDGFQDGYNAFSWSGAEFSFTILSFGGSADYHNYIDVVAHEYTHSIQAHLVKNMIYSGETGALMEAYADVMGELVQLQVTGYADWLSVDRNMVSPRDYESFLGMQYPERLNGAGYYTGTEDSGGVHHNSTVISHAIYTMYDSGLNDVAELTELLYRAWGYLKPSATFYEYRMAMLAAAADMNFNSDKMSYITSAFDEAGIQATNHYEGIFSSVTVNTTVTSDSNNSAVPNANIRVELLDGASTVVADVTCDENGVYSLTLDAGNYRFTVSATGYETATGTYSFDPESTHNISFVLGRESNQDEEIICEIGGTITDALTNSPISGATLTLRKGYNVTSGRGLVITTNESGQYYTDELEYGFYTLEIAYEGYITSYQTVQAAASNWDESLREDALNQNFSISPYIELDDTLRIVLSWGEYPNDLDSHLTGCDSTGTNFHVFYANSNHFDADTNNNVANLDIDDTSSYGPETITVHFANQTELYKYYVHDYTNKENIESTYMSNSGAKVSVYSGNTLMAVYDIPTNQIGTVWHVFDFDPVSGRLIFVNEFSNQNDASLVGYESNVAPEDPENPENPENPEDTIETTSPEEGYEEWE